MKTALVIGSGPDRSAEIAKALTMFTPDLIIGVNDGGAEYPHVDHFVSSHLDMIAGWVKRRQAAGLQDFGEIWTATHHVQPFYKSVDNIGGSSSLMGVIIGIQQKCDRIVLAGVPLENDQYVMFQKAWTREAEYLEQYVRSMSGWTAKLLGEPNQEWLGVPVPAQPQEPVSAAPEAITEVITPTSVPTT